jgi:hypothetical protein
MTTQNTPPDGILYFIGGQLLFEHHNANGAIVRKCLSPEAARHAFTQQQTDSGWLSPHTIRYGESARGPWLLQRYDPARYQITLDEAVPVRGQSNPIQTITVSLPGMLFLGSNTDYYLWSYRAWKGDHSTLYHAPIPNVHPNGHICFGQNRPPVAETDTIDQAWNLFWQSPFNHDLASEKSQQYPDSILKLLVTLHQPEDHGHATYPDKDLKRSRMTIAQILTQLNPQHADERRSA